MKILFSYFVLWFVISTQSLAAIVSPIGGGYEGQEQYIVEIKSISYFYRLNIYSADHVLLDSTLQFTTGYDLDAFVVEAGDGNFEVIVAMSLNDSTEALDIFSFDGSFLSKNAS